MLDGVLLRLVDKWLAAGVFEAGSIMYPDAGSPQGGVVSPILANIYLHEVLDVWFDREVKPRLSGRAHVVRYADGAVLLFEHEQDARRVMAVLPERFGKYGLTLHPEKTRLVELRRPDPRAPLVSGGAPLRPGTFDLLGFTHYWGKSRAGKWIVRRSTAKDRFRRALRRVTDWCRKHRHDDLRNSKPSCRSSWGTTGTSGSPGTWRPFDAFCTRSPTSTRRRCRRARNRAANGVPDVRDAARATSTSRRA